MRLALLCLTLASCTSDGTSYVLVTVDSARQLDLTALRVTVGNGGASQDVTITHGASFTIPPTQTFSLRFDPSRSGDVTLDVRAQGTSGELARATGGAKIVPGGTATVSVRFADDSPDLGAPADMVHVPAWKAQASNTQVNLNGIWGSSPDDVYVVGNAGTVLHSTDHGKTWVTLQNNPQINLHAMWGSGPNDVFAAGDGGTVLHSMGNAFAAQPGTSTTKALFGVWGSGPQNVFAVGEAGTLIHTTDGSMWSSAMGLSGPLQGIWGSGPSNIYACGSTATIYHSIDGVNWMGEPAGTGAELRHLFGFGPNDIYAVGDAIVHSAGGAWVSQASGSWYGIWGSGPSDVYAVGSKGLISHSTGDGTWSPQTSGTVSDLFAAWGFDSTDVYVVGASGTILHLE